MINVKSLQAKYPYPKTLEAKFKLESKRICGTWISLYCLKKFAGSEKSPCAPHRPAWNMASEASPGFFKHREIQTTNSMPHES